MGWLSDWWAGDDPRKTMDPSLRRYLEREAPRRYNPAQAAEPEPQTYREQLGIGPKDEEESKKRKEGATDTERPLPRESLFPDGRYKHLWATYRSEAELAQSGKSDQEKLMDIVAAFKDRGAEVKEAAMENCADEQFKLHDCMRNGPWSSRMTLCRAENKALNKCVLMQCRFLRALGYAGLYERTAEESDKIQMHADRLYQRLLQQEKLILEAKEKGEPTPPLPPLIDVDKDPDFQKVPVHAKSPDALKLEQLPKPLQEKLQKKFEGLQGPELELARREFDEQLALDSDFMQRINQWHIEERKERLQRQARGEERFGDKVKRYLDFRKYPDDD